MVLLIISFVGLGIQVVFLLTLLIAFRKQVVDQTAVRPPFSIIVCAHDEEENLRELIPMLLSQNYPEFEVIVVEDRCNDGTYDFLLQATKEYDRLKMARVTFKPEHINGKKFALTLGIKAAKYDWVLLTDADCRPASNQWLSQMALKINPSTEIVLGFSPYQKTSGLLNAFIRFESFLSGIQFIGLALIGKPYMGVGRNLAYKKELFLGTKGFNSHLGVTGGDDDLFVNDHATKENTTVAIGANALVFSKPKNSWSEFFHQKVRHLSVGKRYRFLDKIIIGLFSLSLLITWFVALPSLLFISDINYVLSLFLTRLLLLMVLLYEGTKKLGSSFEVWAVPFLDFLYAFYYLVTGVKALFAKKVKWKS